MIEVIPSKTKGNLNTYVRNMKLAILENPGHPDSDLLPLLEQKLRNRDYSLFKMNGENKWTYCKLKDYDG
jgi:hypothetical protein